MPLHPKITGWFEARGWAPRQHQLDVLEATEAGASALLIAPTGAGKTLAGFLPTLAAAVVDPQAPSRRVTLLSSRYHLARCALFARGLGLHWELCAAEPALSWRPGMLWRIAGEAAYVCWLDIGVRWARLIGHRRLIERIS